ncbi:MAG: Na(+)/H(+) antiporter subunit D, partial [Pseudomonadota bacterium]
QYLYALMPEPEALADYHSYTPYHIIEQLQLLVWATIAFGVLKVMKWYPAEIPSTNLDTDWLYRIPGRGLLFWAVDATKAVWSIAWDAMRARISEIVSRIYAVHGPEGQLARAWPIGFMALSVAATLALALVFALAV